MQKRTFNDIQRPNLSGSSMTLGTAPAGLNRRLTQGISSGRLAFPAIAVVVLAVWTIVNSANMTISSLAPLGRMSIIAFGPFFIGMALLFDAVRIDRFMKRYCLLAAPLLLLYLPIRPDTYYGSRGLICFAQLLLVIGVFVATASWKWTPDALVGLANCFALYVLAFFATWVIHPVFTNASWYFANTNGFGALLGLLLFFLKAGELRTTSPFNRLLLRFAMGIALLGIVVSSTRSVALALAAGLAVYFCWPFFCRSRMVFRAIPYLVFFVIGASIWTQTYCMSYLIDEGYGEVVFRQTGKTLDSGRNSIWLSILHDIEQAPLLGQGPEVTLEEHFDKSLSAHCLYLQMAIQAGWASVALLAALFAWTWQAYWPGRKDPVVRLAAGFIVMTLIHQTFEVSLIQNNLALGFLAWISCAIGVSLSLEAARSARIASKTSMA